MVNLWLLSYVPVCDCVFGLGLYLLMGTVDLYAQKIASL